MVVFIMHLLSVAQTHFIYSFYLSHTPTQVKRLKCWVQNVQWDVTANDKGFSCPTGLPFKQTKHSCNLLPSLCISHIFNNYLLVTAATLNICGLDWWALLIKRTCSHMMLTQPPCTTKTAFLFACDLLLYCWYINDISYKLCRSQRLTFRLDKQLLRKTCHLFRKICFWLTHRRHVTNGYRA